MAFLVAGSSPAPAQLDGPWARSAVNLPSPNTRLLLNYDLTGDGRKDLLALSGRRLLLFPLKADNQFDADPAGVVELPPQWPLATPHRTGARKKADVLLLGPGGFARLGSWPRSAKSPAEIKVLGTPQIDLTTGTRPVLADLSADLDGTGEDRLMVPNQDQLEVWSLAGDMPTLVSTLNLPTGRSQALQGAVEAVALSSRYFEGARFGGNPLVRHVPGSARGVSLLPLSHSVAQGRVLALDWSRNGRVDLLAGGRLHLQKAPGEYHAVLNQALAGIHWTNFAIRNQVRTVPNLADINGDGRLDTFNLESVASRLSPRSEFSVYFGRPDGSFNSRPDAVLRTRDFSGATAPVLGDLDGDGAPEIALPHLDIQASSASSQVRMFFQEGLRGELRFYGFDRQRSRFPDAPIATFPLAVNYEMFGAEQLFRPLFAFHADFDGDGRADLAVKTGPSKIEVFRNMGGRRGFERRAFRTFDTAPMRVADMELADLNGDGLADVVATVYSEGSERRMILAFFVSPGTLKSQI